MPLIPWIESNCYLFEKVFAVISTTNTLNNSTKFIFRFDLISFFTICYGYIVSIYPLYVSIKFRLYHYHF
nr:MAG TPA: hypothetical protein [Caudoviricetes sp.]